MVDETGCLYADGIPKMGESGAYNPVKVLCNSQHPPSCKVAQFWNNHSAFLELLANMDIDAIKAQPKDVKELQKVARAAQQIRGGKPTSGNRCTVDLSDAIICLESTHCPEPAAVHSINKKHFRPLCEIFGIKSEPKD